MFDVVMTRMHELIIILYATSVLLYFLDFVDTNQRANRTAFWLLAIVWILQTIFLFMYMFETGRFPILTINEGLYFYAWVLITLSLGINRLLKVDFTVFFTNVLGFIIMAVHTFSTAQIESNVIAEQLMNEILYIHIMMAILSYGAFTISFVFSCLYLLQHRLLKQKKWGKRLRRLADLEKLDRMTVVLNGIGTPLLLLSLILGIQRAVIALPDFSWLDLKIIGSILMLLAYSIVFAMRVRKQLYGRVLAYWNIGCFLIVLINFFLFGRLSGFHLWIS